MNKATFKEKVMECINQEYETYIQQAEQVINNMDEKKLEEFEDNYFAPNAFCEALRNFNNPRVTARTFTIGYAMRYNRAVRMFGVEILYGRY